MPPTSLPGDDALSPLPPLPPRAPRGNRWEDGDPHSDGAPPGRTPRDGWDPAPYEDQDRAPDDEWARVRRDERDERDW